VDAPRHRGRGLSLADGAPFLLVNPRSGDEEPTAGDLVEAAEARGIETHVLSEGDDSAALSEDAADRGARALGIAGGDGSLGPVASVAVDRKVPFVCVPYGTRNHFARDLGLLCDDPIASLAAFGGEERAVDAARVGDVVFLNNVSLGLYASLVHDPAHATKNRLAAALRMIPAAFGRGRRPLELTLGSGGGEERVEALVLLVANNDYSLDAISDLGGRTQLDEGLLHVYVVRAVGRFRLAVLFARALAGRVGQIEGYAELTGRELTVDSPRSIVHVAVDGEPAVLPSPLGFQILPGALRVLVPRETGDDNRPIEG
jgi:diacylglycerol kinase family enzyme